MNRRTAIAILLIALLAAATTWLSRQTGEEAIPAAASEAPDYFLDRFSATELDAEGNPRQRLEATRLAHFPSREAVVDQPRVTVFQPGEAPWQLTAREARLHDEGKVVDLLGGVHVSREGPKATEIETATLQIRPQARYARTADPVTVTTAQGRLQAVGMEAFLDEERVVLHSQVRGVYGP